jgi:hypothetical protein
MNDDPVHGVPGEGDPRRNTLGDKDETGGVDSNHVVDPTGNGPNWKGRCEAAALA